MVVTTYNINSSMTIRQVTVLANYLLIHLLPGDATKCFLVDNSITMAHYFTYNYLFQCFYTDLSLIVIVTVS